MRVTRSKGLKYVMCRFGVDFADAVGLDEPTPTPDSTPTEEGSGDAASGLDMSSPNATIRSLYRALRDHDYDGVVNDEDDCPFTPEDRDGHEDEDQGAERTRVPQESKSAAPVA